MTTALIIIGLLITAVLVFLAMQEGSYTVDRSLLVNAPVEKVYQCVVDFKTWPSWSPWLMHEPDTLLEYSDNYQQPGGFYRWDGKLVGAGKLTHVKQRENQGIEQRIEFLRPFKSTSRVAWQFKAVDDKTEVHWIMQGSMPFFLRFMTAMMADMIAKDYDLGLHLLNGFLDNKNSHPQISFAGEQQLEDFSYLHKPFKGTVEQMIEAMQQGFPELAKQAQQLEMACGKPCTLYFKADTQNMYFECDLAIPVSRPASAENIAIKQFHGGKYLKLQLQGDYRFLELAWYKAYSHAQMLKLKIDKHRPSVEVYENDPQSVDDTSELVTSIFVPLR